MYFSPRLYRSYVNDVVAAAVNADDEKKRVFTRENSEKVLRKINTLGQIIIIM